MTESLLGQAAEKHALLNLTMRVKKESKSRLHIPVKKGKKLAQQGCLIIFTFFLTMKGKANCMAGGFRTTTVPFAMLTPGEPRVVLPGCLSAILPA